MRRNTESLLSKLLIEAIYIPLFATIWWLPLTTFLHANIKWAPMLLVGFVLSMFVDKTKGVMWSIVVITTFWLPAIAAAAALVVRMSN